VQFVLSQRESIVKKMTMPKTSFNRYFANNVVFQSGDDWKRHRQVYNPVFNNVAYRGYFGSFLQTIDKMVDRVTEKLKDSKEVDFAPFLTSFTIDLLGKSILNYDFGRLDGKINEYFEAYRYVIDFTPMRLMYMIFPWLDKIPLPFTLKMKKSLAKLDELFNRVVESHDTSKNDFLSHMLRAVKDDSTAKVHLSDTEFVSNLFIMFVAGHETTSSALSWATYELARNQGCQAKMYDEIHAVVGDREPTFEDLEKLDYVDNFLSENLRLHPPVPMLASRQATTDLHYKNQVIPKGSLLGFNIYNIHHNSEHWKDPFAFNPDRFLAENAKGRHKFSFLPFSLGPRMCLGNHFSLIEQRLYMVRLLQKYEVLHPTQHELPNTYAKSGIGGRDSTWVALKPRPQTAS